jgi:hypothetical protein
MQADQLLKPDVKHAAQRGKDRDGFATAAGAVPSDAGAAALGV